MWSTSLKLFIRLKSESYCSVIPFSRLNFIINRSSELSSDSDVDDIEMLVTDANVKSVNGQNRHQHPKVVTNHFDSNIRHQHRCHQSVKRQMIHKNLPKYEIKLAKLVFCWIKTNCSLHFMVSFFILAVKVRKV